jgi:GxxExxY protein
MSVEGRIVKHRDLTERIIGVFFEVYKEMGHGFLESVYENAIALELVANNLEVKRQISVPVWFRDQKVGNFVADMLVENTVLLELKAVRILEGSHEAQILNYLRATDLEVGLLLNFGVKPQIKRFIFDNGRKQTRVNASIANVFLDSDE